jgi:hypothetical protein
VLGPLKVEHADVSPQAGQAACKAAAKETGSTGNEIHRASLMTGTASAAGLL